MQCALPRQKQPAPAAAGGIEPPTPKTVAIYRGSEKSDGEAVAQASTLSDKAPPLPTVPAHR